MLGSKVGKKNERWKYVSEDDDLVPSHGMLNEWKLLVRYVKGDKRQEDCSCDSKFMLDTMPNVGQAIRDAYRCIGVGDCTPIFLYLDNAGGHSTEEAVLEYCTLLAERFNVICIH